MTRALCLKLGDAQRLSQVFSFSPSRPSNTISVTEHADKIYFRNIFYGRSASTAIFQHCLHTISPHQNGRHQTPLHSGNCSQKSESSTEHVEHTVSLTSFCRGLEQPMCACGRRKGVEYPYPLHSFTAMFVCAKTLGTCVHAPFGFYF